MKKRILAMLLSGLLLLSATACQNATGNEIDTPQNSSLVEEPNREEQTLPQNLPPVEDLNAEVQIPPQDLPTVEEPNAEEQTPPQNSSSVEEPNENPGDIESEYDPATHMRYTLNADGKSYSVCPAGLPDEMKELVFPGEYKGLPVTKIDGVIGEHSIETIVISEGIEEIDIGFYYCHDIKNIYIPASVIYIQEAAFNCRATMGGHGFKKSNVIENIVVAEGNPCYYVDGNCLIEKSSQKIILGCNSSIIPDDGSVKSIGYAAFANCQTIEVIVIPKSILEIEYCAFDNCDNLKKLYLTSSISKDKILVNFNEEFIYLYNPECILYVPDAESLEIYSNFFGAHMNVEVGTP